MAAELFFRIIFSALWVMFLANVAWVGYLTRAATGKHVSRRVERWRVVAVALAVPYFVGVLLYTLLPSWISFLQIPLPDWFRSIIACVAAVGTLFGVWGIRVLGKNWAPSLSGVRNDTVLVTTGPYSIVRNPIYLGAFVFILSLALVAANWLILLPGLALSVILYTQMGEEEARLIDRFGDAYLEYMKQTPRFIPKFTHKHRKPESESSASRT